ncbi:hypothetical protein BKA64DRAFT_760510 [Cadophora sp. MPI-SDFR-AT-0126]|nr:hypothetical protein BKA64DRAFT_760510 [Leotiomycetes sp. MPI-SDFR-AT-0126]
MVRTRSSRNAPLKEDKPEEKYRATEYEWDEEPDEDHPAKKLEVRRAIVSPKSKRGREYTGYQCDETEDEDYKGCWRKKRFKRSHSVEITKVKVDEIGAAKLFKSIPIEIHQQIALFLPKDKDILSYSLVCKKSNFAITNSVWRKRFSSFFDNVAGLSPKDAAEKYKFRKHVSKQWTCFDLNQHGILINKEIKDFQARNQLDVLNAFRGLLLESNACQVKNPYYGYVFVEGRNLDFIRHLLEDDVDIVDAIFNTSFDKDTNDASSFKKIVTANDKNTLVYVIQLLLTPFSLHPASCNTKVGHFDISQYQAYSTAKVQPVFNGLYKQQVNIRWLLHIVNFFKFHLKSKGEGLLAHEYRLLENDEFPQFWPGHIKGGTQPLARHWKGAHMYMEERTLASLRAWDGQKSAVHTDSLDGNESFEDMDLFFDEDATTKYDWPKNFETLLCSNPFEDPTHQRNAQKAKVFMENTPGAKQFWGSCRGSQTGHVFGRVHALTTQQGFHGFQRLTMMKYYTEKDANGHDVYDPLQAWCYEGCVLPGGRIVVGRWWNALGNPNSATTNSGPFLWWNVHRGGAEEIMENEALEFMDTYSDLMAYPI